jgi:hypothetical protein
MGDDLYCVFMSYILGCVREGCAFCFGLIDYDTSFERILQGVH